MSRIRLKLDLDLTAFEDDLVSAIVRRVPGADVAAVREAVHAVLTEDMVVAEWCGKRIFCAEVEAYGPLGGCEET